MSVRIEFTVGGNTLDRIAEALRAQGMRLVNAEVFLRDLLSEEFVNETDWIVDQALDSARVDQEGFDGSYTPPGVELVEDTSRLGRQKKPRDLSGSVRDDLTVYG